MDEFFTYRATYDCYNRDSLEMIKWRDALHQSKVIDLQALPQTVQRAADAPDMGMVMAEAIRPIEHQPQFILHPPEGLGRQGLRAAPVGRGRGGRELAPQLFIVPRKSESSPLFARMSKILRQRDRIYETCSCATRGTIVKPSLRSCTTYSNRRAFEYGSAKRTSPWVSLSCARLTRV